MGRKKILRSHSPSEFGSLVKSALASTGTTQTQLAESTNTSVKYVNHMITGRKAPSAEWVSSASTAMGLSSESSTTLYRAAAEDNLRRRGFDIDLTKKD